MYENKWMRLGERMMDAGSPRARARLLVDEVPTSTLAGLGLARTGTSMAVAMGAFAVGAVLGAGAVIFLAPGSDSVRSGLAAELQRTKRLARKAASRARGATERMAEQETPDGVERIDDAPMEARHDAHA